MRMRSAYSRWRRVTRIVRRCCSTSSACFMSSKKCLRWVQYWLAKAHYAYALHRLEKFEEAKVVYEAALAGMETDAKNAFYALDFGG